MARRKQQILDGFIDDYICDAVLSTITLDDVKYYFDMTNANDVYAGFMSFLKDFDPMMVGSFELIESANDRMPSHLWKNFKPSVANRRRRI